MKDCTHPRVRWDIDYQDSWCGPEDKRSMSFLICHCADCGTKLPRSWFLVTELRTLAAFMNEAQIRAIGP